MVTKKHNHPNKRYTTDGKLSNEDQHEIVMGQLRAVETLIAGFEELLKDLCL